MGSVFRVYVPKFERVPLSKFGKLVIYEDGDPPPNEGLICNDTTYKTCVAECISLASAIDYVAFVLTDDVMARSLGIKDNVEHSSITRIVDEFSGDTICCPLHEQLAFPIFIVQEDFPPIVGRFNVRDIVAIAVYGLSEKGNEEFTRDQIDVSVGHLNFIFLNSTLNGFLRHVSEVKYYVMNNKLEYTLDSIITEEFLKYLMEVMTTTTVSIGYKISIAHAI